MATLKDKLKEWEITEEELVQFIESSKYRKEARDKDYVLYRDLAHLATREDLGDIKTEIAKLDKKILTEEKLDKKLENYPTKEYIQKEFINIHKSLNSQLKWIIGIFIPLIISIIGILIKLLISNKL